MRQSSVLKYIYDTLSNNLAKFGNEISLFSIGTTGNGDSNDVTVFLNVSDIVQSHQDKTGEMIVFEKTRVPAPTHVTFIVAITVVANEYSSLLESMGAIIQYLYRK